MTRDEALDLMYIAFNKSMCESARRMRDDLLIGADGAWREPEHIAEVVHDVLNGAEAERDQAIALIATQLDECSAQRW